MSCLADDYESSLELAENAARILKNLDPKHELLRFWFCSPEEMKDGEPIPEIEEQNRSAMKERFWQRKEPWQQQSGLLVTTVVITNYFLALKEAIKKIDQTVQL